MHELELENLPDGRIGPATDHNALLVGICQKLAAEPAKLAAEPAELAAELSGAVTPRPAAPR